MYPRLCALRSCIARVLLSMGQAKLIGKEVIEEQFLFDVFLN